MKVSRLAPPSGYIPMCDIKQGSSPFVGLLPSPSMVVACPGFAKIEQLRFFDPTFFRAGEIHSHLPVWEKLLSGHSSSQVNFINIAREGVEINCLFKPFKGNFKVVRKMIYPVTWDGAVRVSRFPFTRPRRLIPTTYHYVLFKPMYQPYFLLAFCLVSLFLPQGSVWDYGCKAESE